MVWFKQLVVMFDLKLLKIIIINTNIQQNPQNILRNIYGKLKWTQFQSYTNILEDVNSVTQYKSKYKFASTPFS